jgi:hypothetical protein
MQERRYHPLVPFNISLI